MTAIAAFALLSLLPAPNHALFCNFSLRFGFNHGQFDVRYVRGGNATTCAGDACIYLKVDCSYLLIGLKVYHMIC